MNTAMDGEKSSDLDSSSQDLVRQLAELREEYLRLQRENESLRQKLGLPSETGENVRPPEVEQGLFSWVESLPMVDSNSSVAEKVVLFRTLFRGREDVYPIYWVNERSDKSGYSLAVKGGWLGPRERPKDYLPLTDEVIEEHLGGQKIIGVYPLLKDDTRWFSACDFDGVDWIEDAVGYLSSCLRNEVPAYLERSRSGKGGHVWIFFSQQISAASARRLGASLLRETMLTRKELDLASYDRFFPNQDFLPKGGFGNLIALPLQKKSRALGNTEFIDPKTLQPWPDQWAFLSRIQRLSRGQLDGLIEKLPPVSVGLGSGGAVRKTFPSEETVPRTIRCTIGAGLSLEKIGLPSTLLSEIKHLASLHNPVFYERQKLRLSTYRTPRFIKCFEQDPIYLHFPRGLLEELTSAVEAAGSRLQIKDLRPMPDKIELSFQGELTSFQEESVKAILAKEQGVLVAPPGTGKTVMGCFIAAARNLPTLIIVHRKPLLDQWRVQLMNLLGLPSEMIGQIGGGKDKRTGVVDLAMIQSLKGLEGTVNFFSDYGFIIVDECHHIPAYSFESCIKQAPTRYILGMTATPYRRDGLQDIIMMQCGPIRYRLSRRSSLQSDLELKLLVRETGVNIETHEAIQEIFQALVHDSERNQFICQDVMSALEEGRRCLVLSQWKEHCRILAEQLEASGKKPFVLVGGLRKKARTALFEAIRNIPAQEDLLVIATGQYLGEGFDCPQLDTLFLAFPVAFKGRLVQYTGRLMRLYEGKRDVKVYDYADVRVSVLKKMHAKRLKTYQALGFVEAADSRMLQLSSQPRVLDETF